MGGHDGNSPHIVVIDDDAAIRSLFDDLLASEGYRASLLAAPVPPADLLRLLPDLLILDVLVGGRYAQDGRTCLHELKDDPTTAALPVLICSGATELFERLRADLEQWGWAICPKPFDLDEILDAVRSCLAGSETNAAAG
jgi:two-component system, OmpR family, phosphate regulon response regulator OmpR